MTKQTKLVHCGSTNFIYDFNCSRNIKHLEFEKDIIEGSITNIKRLLLTNFANNKLLATFSLKIPLNNKHDDLQNKLKLFINNLKKSSGHSKVKYFAVINPPSVKNQSYAYIKLVTDIEIHELTSSIEVVLLDENEEMFFEGVWGDEVHISVYSPSELLNIFSEAYRKSLSSENYSLHSKVSFKSRLYQPVTLWNEEADAFIKKLCILDYPKQPSYKIYDKTAGFVIINEYSLYDTTPSSEELRFTFH
jgi:hypothetical protein